MKRPVASDQDSFHLLVVSFTGTDKHLRNTHKIDTSSMTKKEILETHMREHKVPLDAVEHPLFRRKLIRR